ncbi:glycoside hydrolase family 27 protein [Zopfia rhizophila CBS 207.26]|uniref:Alpha-galactosidase n=1 Tax=Zopfia rhizophila CBS 207.26 TaxID=1314779 RepID=A0A6A6EUC7_9PEZI|nr:glycoside hydrolase family 27 protein [Zopfia rhizophila CBS 207.26]
MWYIYAFLLGFLPAGTPLILKNDVGRLPALGWNSWNAYHCEITESQFTTAAEKLVELGLKDVGYEYVNIDDCWQIKDRRDEKTKRLIPDPTRFPDGIKGTADKIHKLGLKIGIYSSAGTLTCAGYQASLGYESIDAATWSEWEIDYLKYDNCNVPNNWTDSCRGCVPENRGDLRNGTCTNPDGMCPAGYDYSKSLTAERFRIMRDAIVAQPRTMLYSLCEWGEAGVQQWGNDTGSSWRMSGDINPSWRRVVQILNQNSFYLNNVDFWGHSDADMLEVGNGLSVQESRSHFALWAAMKSPLLIGTDLARIASDQLEILKNKYLIAFNQDQVVGKPAKPYKWGTNPDWTFNETFPAEFWSGASTKGTLVLMFNPYGETRTKTADFNEIPELEGGGSYQVTDVWAGKDLGCVDGKLDVDVQGHDTAALLVGQKCGYGRKMIRGLKFFGDW